MSRRKTIHHAVGRGAGTECGADGGGLAGPGLSGLNCPACWASLKRDHRLDWSAEPVRSVPTDGWRLWDGWLQRVCGVWWLADSSLDWVRVAPGALRRVRRQFRRRDGLRRTGNIARRGRDRRPMFYLWWDTGDGVWSPSWGPAPVGCYQVDVVPF
jgi:hypothetical protein